MSGKKRRGDSFVDGVELRVGEGALENRDKFFWKLIRLLGSLQLALFLLAVIAVACAFATITEARFNAKIAQHYIYKSPWFLFWLSLLCINLFAVTLTRWPWRKKHVGFILTHYGIIVLLIGAAIGLRMGFEGNVTLRIGEPPTDRITLNQSVFQVENPQDFAVYVLPFDASVTRPSFTRQRVFQIPKANWKIIADDYAEELKREPVIFRDEGGGPVVLVRFDGATAATRQKVAIRMGDQPASLFGMANVYLAGFLPRFRVVKVEETIMAFAKWASVREGYFAGADVNLEKDGEKVRLIGPSGLSVVYGVEEVLGKRFEFDGLEWEVMGFWPNFEMRDGQPATRDEKPDNPAMLVRIRGERRFVEGGVLPQEMVKGLGLILAPAVGGQVEFCFLRDGREEKRGYLRVGETIPTGWNDWTVTLEDFELQGVISERIEPVSKGEGRGSGAFSAHAFRARLVVPRGTGDVLEGEPVWVESGRITTLRAGEMRVRVGYGLKLQEVPFFMRLIKFEVPRFEGTEQPANFIATIEFRDKKNNQTRRDVAKMNHPANWPGGFFAVMTGWNYKFSQAEWNPRDLSETTLQVLYDPGWLLKWIGSLAICVGIVLLFYWKPRQSKAGGAERGDSGFKGELKRVGRAACEEKMIVSQRCREN